jgi:hypothetical protein
MTLSASGAANHASKIVGKMVWNDPEIDEKKRVSNWLVHQHSKVHVFVGGGMASKTAADYPEFYLLHSFVDRQWALWQDCHDYDLEAKDTVSLEHFGMDDDDLDQIMPGFVGIAPRSTLFCNDFHGPKVVYALNDIFLEEDAFENCGVLSSLEHPIDPYSQAQASDVDWSGAGAGFIESTGSRTSSLDNNQQFIIQSDVHTTSNVTVLAKAALGQINAVYRQTLDTSGDLELALENAARVECRQGKAVVEVESEWVEYETMVGILSGDMGTPAPDCLAEDVGDDIQQAQANLGNNSSADGSGSAAMLSFLQW